MAKRNVKKLRYELWYTMLILNSYPIVDRYTRKLLLTEELYKEIHRNLPRLIRAINNEKYKFKAIK